MRSVVLIPARYGSSRYLGKPLVALLSKPMILWVAELSANALGKENVYIATEDERIFSVVTKAGFQAVMTSDTALTGTDRLAEAALHIDADIFINVQGDEPLLNPADIIKIAHAKQQHPDCIINGFSWISAQEDPNSVNIPKVITNEANELVYMSRAALPAFKDSKNAPTRFKKQVCIYGFTRQELLDFKNFGRKSELEYSEDIEILRFFELNKKIIMVEVTAGSLAVDIPEDVAGVELKLAELIKAKN
jgi:3-deoxy-manno-octulosonate cytidylyltransferase (CMP-KDO synthetase)